MKSGSLSFSMMRLNLAAVVVGLGLSMVSPLAAIETLPADVSKFVQTHCVRCHQGKEANSKVDFLQLIEAEEAATRHFATWKQAARLIAGGEMPPADEPQPSASERAKFDQWYRRQFEAVAARPGPLRVRRLSVIEYRNTLESLFGFPLKVAAADAEQTRRETSLVMKLMPVDPKGASGFTNDTRDNPLTPIAWDVYGYLADTALLQLFSNEGHVALERYAGPIDHAASQLTTEQASQVLARFLFRAWRRPIDAGVLESHRRTLDDKQGSELTVALRRELKVILLSPEFMYRSLLAEKQSGRVAAVDPFELAERLSYFLWADMPDEELLAAAESGALVRPDEYRRQVSRLLKSPKARSLAEVFGNQWLLLDEIDAVTREVAYAAALKGQPIEFLHDLIVHDRPLRELIDSRHEFVNLYLANFYSGDARQLTRAAPRDGVEQETFPLERIELQQTTGRGGLLTMPGVLVMNKGAIQRGTWLLERILDDPLGEPPPDVPPVKPQLPGQKLSFRERFAEHRANQACAVCHDRIDPLGFAFEAYDERGGFLLAADADRQAVGKFRPAKNSGGEKTKRSDVTIDASGLLPTGERFQNVDELKQILTGSQWPRVVENLVRRMLSYALCRDLTATDEPMVKELTAQLSRPGATWGDLLQAVAGSVPFQQADFEPIAPPAKTSAAR